MKFRMVPLGYKSTPDYPWDYRIELTEYQLHERECLSDWLEELGIVYISAGWNTGSVLYMKKPDAVTFALRWAE